MTYETVEVRKLGGCGAEVCSDHEGVASPCIWFDPERDTMLTTPPEAPPYSAEYVFLRKA